ncbi:MAG: MmgE/PrpD family protein [Clostridiales Family XIII bacterium]|jgi:2-methylcitrate dehydratase PrpD|nr:MmgE/PrpD family protein [Clostridiales Family XIII bacterium]
MAPAIPSISEQIAAYYLNADQNAIPENVIYHAKECILDFIGCAIGGSDLETTQIAKKVMLPKDGHPGEASVVVGLSAPADKAAFINGAACHGLEMDDSSTPGGGHPASVIISAAIAAAEEENADGIELIRAIIWGYDMMCRVSAGAIPDNCFERGWHPTAIFGIFGATVAVGYLKKLNAEQLKNALGVAGGFAAGNLECYADNSYTKRLNPAHAADRGYTAAAFGKYGYSGPRWIFEGAHGFLHAYSDNYTPERMLDNLDYSDYGLIYTAFKPYPSCRYTHAPIDSVLKIKKEHGVKPEDIEKITVDVVSMAVRAVIEPRELKYNPNNIPGAQFSLPYTVACAALYDRVSIKEFTEELLHDKELKAMMDKVEMDSTGKLDHFLPLIFAGEVTIKTKDGNEYTELTTEIKGDPEVPITGEDLKEKFLSLATLNISEAEALKIYDAVFDLDKIKVKELTALY